MELIFRSTKSQNSSIYFFFLNRIQFLSFLVGCWLLLCRTAVDVQLAMRIHPMGRDITAREQPNSLDGSFPVVMFSSSFPRDIYIHTHREKERRGGHNVHTHTQVGQVGYIACRVLFVTCGSGQYGYIITTTTLLPSCVCVCV